MADKRISVEFDASLNASQISGAVEKIQKEFKKINLSGAVQKEFNSMLVKLDEAVKDFSTKAARKEITSSKDMRELESSFNQVMRLYGEIQTKAKSLGGLNGEGLLKILPKNFGQEFNQAKQYLAEYKSAVEKNEKEIADIKEKIGRANSKAQEQRDKKQVLESKQIVDAYQKQELIKQKNQAKKEAQNYEKQIKEKKEALEKFEAEHQNKITKSGKINRSFKDSDILQEEYNRLKSELAQKEAEVDPSLQKAIWLYNKLDSQINNTISQSKFDSELEKIVTDLQKAEQEVSEFTTKLQSLESGTIEFEKFEELRKEIQKLTTLDLSNLNPDAEGLKELEKVFTNLQAGKLQEAKEQLENLLRVTTDMGGSVTSTKAVVDGLSGMTTEATRAAQEMERLKDQVLDFFSLSNTIQIFKNAVRDAFETVKELDAVMTETAVVTDFSIGDMWEKLPEYASKATAMGASIKDLYSATTLYYQQGLNTDEAMGLGVETMKMARIANMDATAATEAMTAALRGFNMEINNMNAERINDVYSELAAVTAADTSQIATAMSKTASIASAANMEFETTAAFLAQIIETTQEAPETAGTAMKTIIARFTEVKQLFNEGMLSGKDAEGEEININKIDEALKTVGISLKDFLTGSKGIDDIFLELASKWDTLDLATQRYIATTAAGSRQQSRFIAMMSNYDRTMELVGAANSSAGASQEQFGKTLDSLDAKLQRLQNAWAEFTMGLANNQVLKAGIDVLASLLETINKLTGATGNEGIGGLVTSFSRFMVLFGTLKGGKNFLTGLFGIPKDSSARGAYEKLSEAVKKFKEAGSVGSLLDVAMESLSGGFTRLGESAQESSNFVKNTAIELVNVGKSVQFLNLGTKAANSSVGAFFLGLGKLLVPIAAITVAIIGLVHVYKAIQSTTPEGKLQAAQEATKLAGEAADAAAESYNNLKSALDSLAGKESNLANLTRGTQEWRDAVQELNADVLSLVNNYPELGAFLENSGGVLTINTDKEVGGKTVDSILKESSLNVFKTQGIEAIRKADEIKAQKEVEQKDFQKILDFENYGSEKNATSAEILAELIKAYDSGELSQIRSNTTSDIFAIEDWLYQKGYAGYSVVSSKDFALKDLKAYAQNQAMQDEAVNTQYLFAAQSALNMANLSSIGEEALTNLDSDILSKGYEQTYNDILETQKLTFSDLQLFALQNSGAGYSYKDGKLYLNDTELTTEQTKQHIATVKATEQYAANLEKLSAHMDNDFFNAITSQDGKDISKEDLHKYTTYDTGSGTYKFDDSKITDLVTEAGFDNIKDMANSLGMGVEDLTNILSENFESAGDRLIKARKSVITNMSKYGAMSQTEAFGYQDEANYLALMEEIVGESYLPALENLFSSLEMTGDSDLISGALESFKQLGVTKESVAEIDNLISNIDWTNPIEATKAITQEIQYGTSITKEFAASIEKSGASFFGAESQVKHFLASADYEEIKANLTEVLETNGEIADTDISNLLDDFKMLNQLLKNTGMSASAAAKMIQSLIQGKLTVDQLSNAVLAAITNFDSLTGISSGIIDKMSNYDLGIDENQVTETLGSWSEILMDNLKKGAYGNTQNFRILDFLFGEDWDKDLNGEKLTGQALAKRMEELAYMVEQNAETMWHSWDDLAKGRNYKGEQFNKELLQGLEISHNAQGGFDIAGYEAKTTSEIVDIIKNAYGVSREYAEMMVTDFKNNSLDMATALAENDYLAGIEAAKEELREFAGEKIVDESELKAIGDFYGKSIEDVRKALEISEDNVTHFWTDKGQIKQTKDLISELNNLKPNFAEQFREDEILNVTELQNALQDLRIPESAQAAIVEDFARLAKDGSDKIRAVLSDGTLKDIEVTAGQSIEQAIDQAEQDLQNEKLADAIASAFENIQAIKVKADIDGLVNQIKTYLSQKTFTIKVEANIEGEKTTTVIPQQDSDDNTVTPQANTEVIESQMDEVFSPKTVDANVSESSIADGNAQIDAMVEPRTLVIWVDFDLTGNGMDVIGGFLGAVGHARGIKNSPTEHDALVSEEGPELIQTKDGFYLTGQNGPEMAHINKGDTVYTAEETKQILKPRNHKIMSRFNDGLSGSRNISGYLDHLQSGEGSNSSSEDEDEEPWENSFDKLYNLIRKIEEENRQRERIERRYEQLLESISTSAKGLVQISREELTQLSAERQLQKDLISGRLEQIAAYEQEKGMTNYAWTEVNKYGEKILRVNWELIDKITDSEQGDEVSEYINQLEEWIDSINKAEDTLIDIEDAINDIKKRGKDEYSDLEEKIKDAIVKAREEEIEQLNQINNSISDSTSDILDSLQKTLDRQRQLRENQDSEMELSELRRQLAYLEQDTSGANDLRIQELLEEINNKTTDYTDQLIDQKISELQDQNEKASEQRQWQIELAQAQLDQYVNSGEIWNEVYRLMDEGLDKENGLVRGSQLDKLLKDGEGYEGLSKIGQMTWLEELTDLIAQGLGYLELGRQLEDLQGASGIPKPGESIVFFKDGKYYEGILQEDGAVKVGDKKYNNVYQGYDGKFYAGENYAEDAIRVDNEGNVVRPEKKPENNSSSKNDDDYDAYWAWIQWEQQKAINNAKDNVKNAQEEYDSTPINTKASVIAANKLAAATLELEALLTGIQKDPNLNPTITQHKEGGIVDYTGPSWLDGTKSKPEYVLSSIQTRSFLTLVDVLDTLRIHNFQTNPQNETGDTFDIDINIETVKEEVDVDMVAEKVQKSVVSASRYRNNIFAKR